MDDWVFIDLLFIVEYNVNARSESLPLLPLPVEDVDVCFVSLREKSTGSVTKKKKQ